MSQPFPPTCALCPLQVSTHRVGSLRVSDIILIIVVFSYYSVVFAKSEGAFTITFLHMLLVSTAAQKHQAAIPCPTRHFRAESRALLRQPQPHPGSGASHTHILLQAPILYPLLPWGLNTESQILTFSFTFWHRRLNRVKQRNRVSQ